MSRAPDDELDIDVLAARGGALERTFSLAQLPRIAALGAGKDSRLSLRVRAAPVGEQVALRGTLRGTLELQCQRCLGWVDVPVEANLDLVPIASEAAMEEFAGPGEAILADPARLDLAWLAEEEALLTLPIVPLHESGDPECVERATTSGEDQAADAPERQKPFANLRDLLDRS